MVDKFDIYTLLGILVPGILVVSAIPLAQPDAALIFISLRFPEPFAILALTALCVFTGQLIQAIASLVEPLLYWSWGGRPSDRALEVGLGERYLPAETGKRIRAKLAAVVGADASTGSLFIFAMQRAENCGSPRVSSFNALYAYHRVLVVLALGAIILYALSFHRGLGARLTFTQNIACSAILIGLPVLFWYRAKQRSYYWVREVLLCAERELAKSAGSPSTSNIQ